MRPVLPFQAHPQGVITYEFPVNIVQVGMEEKKKKKKTVKET